MGSGSKTMHFFDDALSPSSIAATNLISEHVVENVSRLSARERFDARSFDPAHRLDPMHSTRHGTRLVRAGQVGSAERTVPTQKALAPNGLAYAS